MNERNLQCLDSRRAEGRPSETGRPGLCRDANARIAQVVRVLAAGHVQCCIAYPEEQHTVVESTLDMFLGWYEIAR